MNLQQKNKMIATKIKEKNIPYKLDENAVKALIERIAGKKYADIFTFIAIEPLNKGMDRYIIEDTADNKICIRSTSGVAAACAFKWYIENRCDSYVGPLTRRLNFPEKPPKIGETKADESICLYRYFLNYCTYGYTLAFWKWDKWLELLDWMMLSGYNLVLNPLGHEMVWIKLLEEIGYTSEEANKFLSAPTFFPWQCMMNLTTWGGAAPREWYKERVELSKQINEYLNSFGATAMLPGFSGMVPADFKEHFPISNPINQGLWCRMPRPSILLPTDPLFSKVAETFYRNQAELFGTNINYFSTDPFHEGGDSSVVELKSYAQSCLSYMKTVSNNPVWFLQGWQENPIRDMLRSIPVENVLIGNLRSTDSNNASDNFADYPWLYCCVNNFGGQRVMRGNMNKMLTDAHSTILDDNYTAVGIGIIPEGIENDEILYDIFADMSMTNGKIDTDKWLESKIKVRYGSCPENTLEAWKILRDNVYIGDTEKIPLESSFLTRPSLTVDMVSSYSSSEHSYDITNLNRAFKLFMKDYDIIQKSDTYRLDMIDVARQIIDYIGWDYLKGIQKSFISCDEQAFEENAEAFMALYDIIEALMCCNKHTMLGNWLETAKSNGKTVAEKAYFEFLAKTLITLWGDRDGAAELRDYAAKEWSGMIEDFYRPRWNSYINILRRSFVTGDEPLDFNRYDFEYFFTTLSKNYPTEPYGDLDKALKTVLNLIQ